MQQPGTGTGGACAPLSEILPSARDARFVRMTKKKRALAFVRLFPLCYSEPLRRRIPDGFFYDAALTGFFAPQTPL
jgi:hypothetical protein